MENYSEDDDDIESVSIDEIQDTGEVIATTTRIIKNLDGSSRKVHTTERFEKGRYFI